MNVTRLIRELEKIAKKHPRAKVYAEAETFASDCYSHGLVNSVDVQWLTMSDGDGYSIENKDGTEHQEFVVVLSGH